MSIELIVILIFFYFITKLIFGSSSKEKTALLIVREMKNLLQSYHNEIIALHHKKENETKQLIEKGQYDKIKEVNYEFTIEAQKLIKKSINELDKGIEEHILNK